MRLRSTIGAGRPAWRGLSCVVLTVLLIALAGDPTACAADAAAPPPESAPAVGSGGDMNSAGWVEHILMQLEAEAMSDIGMLPATPSALEREWRSFDRNGSALGALINFGWVTLAAIIALFGERVAFHALSFRVRRTLRGRSKGPAFTDLLRLLLCDIGGVAVFFGVFIFGRHWLLALGVNLSLVLLAANVLIRWRIAMLIIRLVLRPAEPTARLIELPDDEARRLTRFLSAAFLAINALIGFGRYGLMDEDSGAHHVISLLVAALVFGINGLMVFRARRAAEALIRGRNRHGVIAALRAGFARGWLAMGLTLMGGLLLFFVFGLSLGLLAYFDAAVNTFAVLLVLLVLERVAERSWHDSEPAIAGPSGGVDRLVAHGCRRIARAVIVLIAAMTLAWIWVGAIELPAAEARQVIRSMAASAGTLFIAYIAWVLARLAIDRHLQEISVGPKLPGTDDDNEAAPGSRLQTILPMLRAAFGVVIAVIAILIVLSRLGIDTAPLIAGAGVFGLAISFGSQSLVRDIISGLFYMWDDAFRVGEYIDTGRLRGTVEALGIRSVKLRHHNGPLHTIPYGQLGAVTNQSRDFATLKFNLRLAPGTDLELVRKTAKQIGIAMQQEPEIAADVMLPLKLQGIAEITENAVVARFKFTARPVKPSWVQREYLKRLYRVFAEKRIEFASNAMILQMPAPLAALAAEAESDDMPTVPSPAQTPLALPAAAASRVA
jgi:moderate conductance mechanosensitive channel